MSEIPNYRKLEVTKKARRIAVLAYTIFLRAKGVPVNPAFFLLPSARRRCTRED